MGKKLTRSSISKINKELEEVLTQDDVVHNIEDDASSSKVLSQKAGKELVEKIEKKVDIDNIVDDLETEDNKLPLSAQQGVELKRMIEDTVRKLIQQGSISIKIEKTFTVKSDDLITNEDGQIQIVINESSQIKI